MLRERYLEAHDLVMRAWTEKDTFAFNGRYNQQRYVNIWPRPVQQPHPPVWIPGGGSIETWQWCAEMDYVYAYLSYFGYKDGKETMDGFWGEMARLGKDRNPNRAAFLQIRRRGRNAGKRRWSCIANRRNISIGRCLLTDPMWAAPPGYITEATQRAGLTSQVGRAATQSAAPRRAPTEMADIVDKGYVIVGSPDDVVEQLTEVARILNVAHLMLLLQFGNMNKDLAKFNTKLFAEKVMPRLKQLFGEWEHRWWPKPMDDALRAEVPAWQPQAAE